MLKAEQSAIINEANVDMVGLRSSEIQYFSQFFSSFGTQAALISGFIVGNVTQIPGLDSKSHFLWIYLFWLTSALAFCSAMHVLICSIFISVYGQGLALRGPTGSMVKAVEGMIIEQDSIVTSFGFTVLFLGLNLIGTCGIMMSFPFAVISSIITTMGMFVWYQACLRIHNRFKFIAPSCDWDPENDNDDWDPESNSSKVHHYNSYGSIGMSPIISGTTNSNSGNTFTAVVNTTTRGILPVIVSGSNNIIKQPARMEGYLSTVDYIFTNINNNDTYSSSISIERSKKWSRKYFVLKNSHMFYYADKESSYYQAEHPINKRPISFSGYSLHEEIIVNNNNLPNSNTNATSAINTSTTTKTTIDYNYTNANNNSSSTTLDTFFTLILTPKADDVDFERVWKFRCDNYEELVKWKEALLADGLVHYLSPRGSNNNNNNNENGGVRNANNDTSTAGNKLDNKMIPRPVTISSTTNVKSSTTQSHNPTTKTVVVTAKNTTATTSKVLTNNNNNPKRHNTTDDSSAATTTSSGGRIPLIRSFGTVSSAALLSYQNDEV